MIRRGILALLGCLLLAGCSSTTIIIEETPSPVISTPAQGRSLSDVGFTHEPAELLWLPTGIRLTYTADRPNLLTVTGLSTQADQVEEYLRQNLPLLGWRITADADGGLLFEQGEWQGAYVVGEDSWALTVRND